MPITLRTIGRLVARLVATCLLVVLVMMVFVNTPFFSSDNTLTTPALALDPPLATARPMSTLDSSEDALLSGHLFGPTSDAQIHMQEYELEGPCEGAGLRLKAKLCDSCVLLPGSEGAADVSLVMWVDDAQSTPIVTTTTTDCSQLSGNGKVVASAISMGPGVHIGVSGVEQASKIIPSLGLPYAFEERMNLTLGNWAVEEYHLTEGWNVLRDIQSALVARGWTLPEGQARAQEQLTFVSSEGKMLIVTVVKEDAGLSIVAMLNNQEEGTS